MFQIIPTAITSYNVNRIYWPSSKSSKSYKSSKSSVFFSPMGLLQSPFWGHEDHEGTILHRVQHLWPTCLSALRRTNHSRKAVLPKTLCLGESIWNQRDQKDQKDQKDQDLEYLGAVSERIGTYWNFWNANWNQTKLRDGVTWCVQHMPLPEKRPILTPALCCPNKVY